jgi:hypothetical protein
MNLTLNPSVSIIDCTKLKTFFKCPRAFFFEHVLGWRPSQPNHHLQFGIAWHLAMEELLKDLKEHGTYTDLGEALAILAFKKGYEAFADHDPPKSLENGALAIHQYRNQWQGDDFEVLFTEVAGTITVGENRQLHFRLDAPCRDSQGVFVLEHKTTQKFGSNYEFSWNIALQTGAYTHFEYCYFPEEVKKNGVVINVASLSKPPIIKKDGTPRAGSRENEFLRIPVRRSLESQQNWLHQVNYAWDLLDQSLDTLLGDDSPDNPIQYSFPCNPESCYYCNWLTHCVSWDNPLRHVNEVPTGYEVSHWNPADVEEGTMKVAL